MTSAPLWGNFVGYADEDFLAFGLLAAGGLYVPAFYHSTQAVEKYLKALALSITDPSGAFATPDTEKWLKTHDLSKLATRCGTKYPFYLSQDISVLMRRFSEFDQAARYPWIDQKHGNGFNTSDVPIFGSLICQLRNDIPIAVDNYKLGMEVRGHFHLGKTPDHTWSSYSHQAVEALRKLFPNLDSFVRQ